MCYVIWQLSLPAVLSLADSYYCSFLKRLITCMFQLILCLINWSSLFFVHLLIAWSGKTLTHTILTCWLGLVGNRAEWFNLVNLTYCVTDSPWFVDVEHDCFRRTIISMESWSKWSFETQNSWVNWLHFNRVVVKEVSQQCFTWYHYRNWLAARFDVSMKLIRLSLWWQPLSMSIVIK